LQFQTTLIWQPYVKDEAARCLCVGLDDTEKFERASIRSRIKTGCREQPRGRLSGEFIVIDNVNGL
jgi:hypothetical protein